MIKMGSNNNRNLAASLMKQGGAVVLMTATLLLIIATLTTLYTGRNQSFEHQIIVNNQNYKMAFMAAEAGLQKKLAMLQVNKGSNLTLLSGSLTEHNRFTVNTNSKPIATIYGNRQLITISSTGISADGLAKATVQEQFLVYPILQNIPVAPLIIQGGYGANGDFELVTNTDGLGVGLPLSIWSDMTVDQPSNFSSTCGLIDYNNGDCATNFITNSAIKGGDILESSNNFPTNIMGYLFNIPANGVEQFKVQSSHLYANCNELNSNSRGLIWVVGDCKVSLGRQIGTAIQPLILVVENGDVLFEKHANFYGVLLTFQSTAVTDHYIDMAVGAAINGAVVSNHKLGIKNSMTRVVYNKNVMEKLIVQDELLAVARVPGSWRDF